MCTLSLSLITLLYLPQFWFDFSFSCIINCCRVFMIRSVACACVRLTVVFVEIVFVRVFYLSKCTIEVFCFSSVRVYTWLLLLYYSLRSDCVWCGVVCVLFFFSFVFESCLPFSFQHTFSYSMYLKNTVYTQVSNVKDCSIGVYLCCFLLLLSSSSSLLLLLLLSVY